MESSARKSIKSRFILVSLLPADTVPAELDGVGGREGADGDHEGDVEHGAPHHTAHSDIVLHNSDLRDIRVDTNCFYICGASENKADNQC